MNRASYSFTTFIFVINVPDLVKNSLRVFRKNVNVCCVMFAHIYCSVLVSTTASKPGVPGRIWPGD
jgi:hypothetical protein